MEYTPEIVINLLFWVSGVVAISYYFYKLCWFAGTKYLAPAILIVLRSKPLIAVLRLVFDSFCKIVGFSYEVIIVRYLGSNEVVRGLSFAESDELFCNAANSADWDRIFVYRVRNGKSTIVRSIKF